ncbi:MAG: alkaline phosphatase PafA [Flavobacterium sp.]
MRKLLFVAVSILFVTAGSAQKNKNAKADGTPKLVVGIVVDQMRNDYLYRFADKYGDGGFKRMLKDGFECRNTNYNYVPTYTGPGHAAIYSGTTPYYNGIIANDWYDAKTGKMMYVTEDQSVKSVGTTSKAGIMSPKNLLATTMTDELMLSNNRQSKVVGVCIKDRGSILPAGHIPTAAYWFDDETGNFVTSTYYTEELPIWVTKFNSSKKVDSYLSKSWETLFNIKSYTVGLPNGGDYRKAFKGAEKNAFPHNLPALREKNGTGLIRSTPFGNSLTVDFAIEALQNEKMGQGKYTDFLAVSFSSTDYVGHQFGINSIEVQDTYARLDKDLERLFAYLDKTVGMDNVLVFLTSDHGAAQNPQQMMDMGIPAGVLDTDKIASTLSDKISEKFGAGKWVSKYYNQQFWLNDSLIDSKKLNRNDIVEEVLPFLRKMDGVQAVYNTSTADWKASNQHTEKMLNGLSPVRSGHIALLLQPNWFGGSYAAKAGTTHGSNYTYDTHVPLVWMGWKIKSGSTAQPFNITDIASTVCDILHISTTNASMGTPMTDLITK